MSVETKTPAGGNRAGLENGGVYVPIISERDDSVKHVPDFIVEPGCRILRHVLDDPRHAFPDLRGKRFIYTGMLPPVVAHGNTLVARGEYFTVDVYDACGYRVVKDHIAEADEIFLTGDDLIGLLDELRARRAGRLRG